MSEKKPRFRVHAFKGGEGLCLGVDVISVAINSGAVKCTITIKREGAEKLISELQQAVDYLDGKGGQS